MSHHSKEVTDSIVIFKAANLRQANHLLFQDLDFSIGKGEQWAFIGESGSGKTALLHAILGQFNLYAGQRCYPAFDSYKLAHRIEDPLFTNRKLMAFIKQQASFRNKENMKDFFYQQRYHSIFSEEADTVEEYLYKEAKKIDTSTKSIRFSSDWVIEHLHLSPLLHKTLIQLSNGETRRLMIATALLEQPLLLLMDNPYIGLDTASRPILDSILSTISKKGVSIAMATTAREIPESTTHIAILENLKIIEQGPKEGLLGKLPKASLKPTWQADRALLQIIKALTPEQNHHFGNAVKMENVNVRSKGKNILTNINWQVKKGEKWSVYGPNGAGKSTLLSMINGDHPQAYANKIYLFDHARGSGESIWDLKQRIGFVSPEMHQHFKGRLTSLQVILSGLKGIDNVDGASSKSFRELATAWMQLLEMEDKKDYSFKSLSAGEQRLVLLARAMIKNPPLLILDEPCQGLDEDQREHFKQIVNTLWDKPNKTLLYVSHYKEDIPSCVTKLLELKKGEQKIH